MLGGTPALGLPILYDRYAIGQEFQQVDQAVDDKNNILG